MSKQTDFEDDGRTIADMSEVSRRNPFGFIKPYGAPANHQAERTNVTSQGEEQFTRKERLWALLGALKAILLIGLCFAIGFALVILGFIYL